VAQLGLTLPPWQGTSSMPSRKWTSVKAPVNGAPLPGEARSIVDVPLNVQPTPAMRSGADEP
jgi:hypothetical protein